MSNRIVPGVVYVPSQRQAAIVDEAMSTFELRSNGNVTDVMCSVSATVKLPDNPRVAETIRISANGGTITVDGNGHAIAGGVTTVDDTTFRDFAFSDAGQEWVPAATGASSGGNPAPPDRSFQFDDAGSFGGSTFHFFDSPDQIRATADGSAITQDDATTGTTFYVYQHLYTPPDDPLYPPGVSLVIGSDNVGTLSSLPDVTYFAAKKWHEKYLDNEDGTQVLHTMWNIGAQANGNAPVLTTAGHLFFPNLMISGLNVEPADDVWGGGQGVEFMKIAELIPSVAASSSIGVTRYVDFSALILPYGLNPDGHIPLYALSPLVWGTGNLGDTSTTTYLQSGYADANTDVDAVGWLSFPCDANVVGLSVRIFNGDAEPAGTYNVRMVTKVDGDVPDVTNLQVDIDNLTGSVLDDLYTHSVFVPAGTYVGIRVTKSGVNVNASNMVVTALVTPYKLSNGA